MASLKQVFNIEGLVSREAQELAIEQQAQELQAFVKGLKTRKSQVFSEILQVEKVTFDAVVALSSLLLQANLYCRRTQSMLLLNQLFANELAEAIAAFYKKEYLVTAAYVSFIKQVFLCFVG